MRPLAILLTVFILAGCSGAAPTGPAGQVSATDQNPITGNRGGSGSK